MADPWQSRMWQGLMQWVEDEQYVERRRIVAEYARMRMAELLSEDHLDELTLDEFNEHVRRFGAILTADGSAVTEEEYCDHAVGDIREGLASGDWRVHGNQMVGQATDRYGVNLRTSPDELPGLLRGALRELLHSGDDLFGAAERVIRGRNGLGPNAVTMILAMLHPDEMSLHSKASIAGAQKLAWLLGTEEPWEQYPAGDYRAFNGLMQEIRGSSGSVLSDMLEVDAFLYRLTLLGEPQHWKIALAPNEKHHDALVAMCVEESCAAIGFADDPDNPSAQRLRDVQPGDYVIMHTKASIGGVGRDFLIGHSYFMQEGLDEALVETIWRYQIAPLLQAYFVGNAGRAEEFKLDELVAHAGGIAEPAEPQEDAAETNSEDETEGEDE